MSRVIFVTLVVVGASAVMPSPSAMAQEQLEPALASLVQLINQHDVEGLVSRVRFVQQPCSKESQTLLQPLPQCPEGLAPGTLVDTFLTASCEPFYVIGPAGARRAMGTAQNTRVYDILTGPAAEGRRPQVRHVIVSAGDPSKQGLLWYVTADGELDGLLSTCSLSASESASSYADRGLTSRLRMGLPATGVGHRTPEVPFAALVATTAFLAAATFLSVRPTVRPR